MVLGQVQIKLRVDLVVNGSFQHIGGCHGGYRDSFVLFHSLEGSCSVRTVLECVYDTRPNPIESDHWQELVIEIETNPNGHGTFTTNDSKLLAVDFIYNKIVISCLNESFRQCRTLGNHKKLVTILWLAVLFCTDCAWMFSRHRAKPD
jgi:hypothetical protein